MQGSWGGEQCAESVTGPLRGHEACTSGLRVQESGLLALKEPALAQGVSGEVFPPLLPPPRVSVFRSPSPPLCFSAQSPLRLSRSSLRLLGLRGKPPGPGSTHCPVL